MPAAAAPSGRRRGRGGRGRCPRILRTRRRSAGAGAGSRSAACPPRGDRRAPLRCRAVSASSPEQYACSSVVLPDPLGPRMATNSPWPISMFTSLQITRPAMRAWPSTTDTAADAPAPATRAPGRRTAAEGTLICPSPGAGRRSGSCSWATLPLLKVSEAGESVSVMVVIGMPAARASWLTRCTSGVAFWLL